MTKEREEGEREKVFFFPQHNGTVTMAPVREDTPVPGGEKVLRVRLTPDGQRRVRWSRPRRRRRPRQSLPAALPHPPSRDPPSAVLQRLGPKVESRLSRQHAGEKVGEAGARGQPSRVETEGKPRQELTFDVEWLREAFASSSLKPEVPRTSTPRPRTPARPAPEKRHYRLPGPRPPPMDARTLLRGNLYHNPPPQCSVASPAFPDPRSKDRDLRRGGRRWPRRN